MSDRGFTLIELLIVLAIIGIIAAIAYPNMKRMIETKKDQPPAVAMVTVTDDSGMVVWHGELKRPSVWPAAPLDGDPQVRLEYLDHTYIVHDVLYPASYRITIRLVDAKARQDGT